VFDDWRRQRVLDRLNEAYVEKESSVELNVRCRLNQIDTVVYVLTSQERMHVVEPNFEVVCSIPVWYYYSDICG
jgi:hypothetical protein